MNNQIEELRIKALALSKVLGEVRILRIEVRAAMSSALPTMSPAYRKLMKSVIEIDNLMDDLIADMKELAKEEVLLIAGFGEAPDQCYFNAGAL